MSTWKLLGVIVIAAASLRAQSSPTPPLKLIQTFHFSDGIKGHFDHFGVDIPHERLFTTPEEAKSVIVFNLQTGTILHKIDGIGKPHAVLYRPDLNRIYVTDGIDGALKIFDGSTYKLLKSIKLLVDADSIAYDSVSKYLYVVNGGGEAHQSYSMISVIDTTAEKKMGDIKIDGDTLEAMALEKMTPRLYVNNPAKNQIDVVDRTNRTLITSWPVTKGKKNVAMALDEKDHRLFSACRSGEIVVIDTKDGRELQALPIVNGVDDLTYDRQNRRLYASGDGTVDVYQQEDADHYKLLEKVPSGPGGRTSRLIPDVHRFVVAVPQSGSQAARVLVYRVQ